jgi:hypothetical protein
MHAFSEQIFFNAFFKIKHFLRMFQSYKCK